jgi:solute carrier family 9 (sodium/hydrogen exchanger), member 8
MHIFPFSAIVNLRRKRRITMPMQIVMWFAGLRGPHGLFFGLCIVTDVVHVTTGAVSFALALSMESPNRAVIITTTLTVVFFTTIVCGGLTGASLRYNMEYADR